MSNNTSKPAFSTYGVYSIDENLDLFLPNNEIRIERIGENAYSYLRKNSDGQIIEKIIPVKSNQLKIELAPIRPLNYPARRTGNVFLKFDKEIYLSPDSAANIFVHCPIEIGIFLAHNSNKESLDWFTCDPLNSRFGFYGSPDSGSLCKYAKVSLATDLVDSTPYVEGVMKITVENNLNSGQTVSKVIFSITNNSLYYEHSKSILDGIKVTMKKRAAVSIADVQTELLDTNWTKSPDWEDTTTKSSMEMGLE